ncbi:MAG: hypothetical protein HQL97_03335 [Magnetococcales bacterium]|nr:hypothetical protein [Magnetococcales bacterium]MBF0260864.1 hypothetical protein [Magnetococcales bacterium]
MKRPLPLPLLAMLMLAGCGHHSETTTQLEDRGYLLLTGRWAGTELSLDGKAPVSLSPALMAVDPQSRNATTEAPQPEKRLFEIASGKHHIVITQQGRVLVDRVLHVTSHISTEVHVP